MKIIVIKAKKCPVWVPFQRSNQNKGPDFFFLTWHALSKTKPTINQEIYQEFVELIITLWHSPTWWFLDKNRLATQPDPNGSFQCLCLSSVVWQWVTAVCHQCSGTWQLTRAAIYMAAAEGVAFISCDSVNTLPVHAAIAITVCKLDS